MLVFCVKKKPKQEGGGKKKKELEQPIFARFLSHVHSIFFLPLSFCLVCGKTAQVVVRL